MQDSASGKAGDRVNEFGPRSLSPAPRPAPPPRRRDMAHPRGFGPTDHGCEEALHPAIEAALKGIDNAVDLPPTDQIAQYEAAYQVLRETLATIDQA